MSYLQEGSAKYRNVKHYVESKLTSRIDYYRDGQLEIEGKRVDNISEIVPSIVHKLHAKGLITIEDVQDICEGYDLMEIE